MAAFRVIICSAAICMAAVGSLPAAAADDGAATGPDPVRGQELAERLCSTCHVVGEDATGKTVQAGVPSFPTIANKTGQTGNAISLKMIAPNKPMPDAQLTRAEILHLLAYLQTLRTVDGESLLPPTPKAPTPKTPPTEKAG